MDIILDFGFAWISVLLVILLSVIFILRKLIQKNKKFSLLIKSSNKILRKYHKVFGIALIATGLIHGFFSSESLFSFNLGTISWVFSILLGLNFMLRKHIKANKGWMYYHRILTIGFLSLLVLHIYDVGIQAPYLLWDSVKQSQVSSLINDASSRESTLSDDSNSDIVSSIGDSSISNINEQLEGVVLKDGTYEGEATGYQDGLIVSVELKDNVIVSIQIIDHNEKKSRFYTPAIEQIPEAIIDSQSLDVDTVSGSTFTSVGIINAVKNALSQALISGSLPEDVALPSSRGRH
jgi:uncharacterized protein with FMN-binding domain